MGRGSDPQDPPDLVVLDEITYMLFDYLDEALVIKTVKRARSTRVLF